MAGNTFSHHAFLAAPRVNQPRSDTQSGLDALLSHSGTYFPQSDCWGLQKAAILRGPNAVDMDRQASDVHRAGQITPHGALVSPPSPGRDVDCAK